MAPLNVQNENDAIALDRLVKTLNKIDVTQAAVWENMQSRVRVCASENDCCDLVVEAIKEKTMNVYLETDNANKAYLIQYHMKEPSFLIKVRNFILRHIILFAVFVFGIAGYAWDSMKKRKKIINKL